MNNLKLGPSSTNLAFEHVRHVTGPVAILQYWWRCTILMQLVRLMWQPDHSTIPWCETDEWLACIHDNAKDTSSTNCGRPCSLHARCWAMAHTSKICSDWSYYMHD